MLEERLKAAAGNADEIRGFVEAAAEGYGQAGEQAALFLLDGMPERDLKGLKKDFLLENLEPRDEGAGGVSVGEGGAGGDLPERRAAVRLARRDAGVVAAGVLRNLPGDW